MISSKKKKNSYHQSQEKLKLEIEKEENRNLRGELGEETFAEEDRIGEHELGKVFLHTIRQ